MSRNSWLERIGALDFVETSITTHSLSPTHRRTCCSQEVQAETLGCPLVPLPHPSPQPHSVRGPSDDGDDIDTGSIQDSSGGGLLASEIDQREHVLCGRVSPLPSLHRM